MGHIRALKEEIEAIGFKKGQREQTWSPHYESIATKRDAIASLKKAAKGAEVYLGADDDREGEAIAWHTCQILGLDPATAKRVVFHEITEQALLQAVGSPGRIDMNKFNAQQARTMLDMLIGFTLSPCLWRGVGYKAGLSAGRCQTPALRIIYDRDRAIESHTVQLSWRIQAKTEHDLLWTAAGAVTEADALTTLKELAGQKPKTLTITNRVERISTSQPPAPFITSSLQQEASNRLSMNPKITMKVAQTLYEAGHITYMRTDNATLSEEAKVAASEIVTARWGAEYLGLDPEPKVVKKKKKVSTAAASPQAPAAASPQAPAAAHEAIRPTHFELTDITDLTNQEQRLYKLIWNRAIQSVMAPETRDVVKLTATPTNTDPEFLTLETSWDQTRFAGYRILDTERKAEEEAAEALLYTGRKDLKESLMIPWLLVTATEVRTNPPPRYTEASLIRELESKGIGRPSTYATLVETVLDRTYVEKATIQATPIQVKRLELKASAKEPKATTKTEKVGAESGKLRTTPLGRTVIEWLLKTFGDMLDYGFTASMESQLDEVAKGLKPWAAVLQNTWTTYADRYETIMATPQATSGSSVNKNDFGDGYKMVVSKKGPLFVLEVAGQKTRFASVPANLSIQTATRADAEAAFAQTAVEPIGELEGSPVTIKKGPYGFYATWKDHKVNCKVDETLESLTPRLLAKTDAVDHTVGPYKIRKGPYGLYMFKASGGKKKPTFVSLPDTTEWATLTPESAEQIYNMYKKPVKT
jgi:DNA topoisomerase-1